MKKLLFLLVGGLFCASAYPAIINVPGEQSTIQDGIDAASPGDTVLVASGVYTGPGFDNLHTDGKPILVAGEVDGTILEYESGVSEPIAFNIADGEDTTTVIRGFTISGFETGIALIGASPTLDSLDIDYASVIGIDAGADCGPRIRNSIVHNCEVGMELDAPGADTLIVDHCVVEHCNDNGIVYEAHSSGELSLTVIRNSTIRANPTGLDQTSFGSAPLVVDSCLLDSNEIASTCNLHIMNSEIRDGIDGVKSSREQGHSLIVDDCLLENLTGNVIGRTMDLAVSGTTIQNNPGQVLNGDIMFTDTESDWSFADCNILDNGGGIYIDAPTTFSFSNCTYTGNGAGIYYQSWHVSLAGQRGRAINDISNCVITGNIGDGVYISTTRPDDLVVSGCTIVDNTGIGITVGPVEQDIALSNNLVTFNDGGGIQFDDTLTIASWSLFCHDVWCNDGGNYLGLDDQTGSSDNISANPRFCDPDMDDYTLADNSPCSPDNSECGTLIGALPVACGQITNRWYVSTTGSDVTGDGSESNPLATIQTAIDLSASGDSVLVGPGVFIGEGNEGLHTDGKAILVRGEMATTTIIAADALNAFRIIGTGEDSTTIIRGFTIQGFYNGVFLLAGVSPLLDSLIIEQNTYCGIWAPLGNEPIIRNCEIAYNQHGIYAGRHVRIEDCMIAHHNGTGVKAAEPGGINEVVDGSLLLEPKMHITGCTIRANGLGIGFEESIGPVLGIDSCLLDSNILAVWGEFRITNSTVRDGVDGLSGERDTQAHEFEVENCLFEGMTGSVLIPPYRAAVVNSDFINNPGQILSGDVLLTNLESDWSLVDCQIIGNGGGIYIDAPTSFTMSGCTYSDNGAGIYFYGRDVAVLGGRTDLSYSSLAALAPGDRLNISQCLISGNTGDALTISSQSTTDDPLVTQLTVVNNTGNGITIGSILNIVNITNSIVSDNGAVGIEFEDIGSVGDWFVECNDIWQNGTFNYFGISDQTGLNGNLSEDPQYCDSVVGDFRINTSSPCAAPNNDCELLIGALEANCTCCMNGMRGDINGDLAGPNIQDLTFLVAYFFDAGAPPPCDLEADVNGDLNGPNIQDLTYFVAFLFGGGAPPADCP